MAHALTSEAEEIMGLLLGDVVDMGGQGKGEKQLKARIWSVSLHRREQAVRSDDRVEISPEQLAAASSEAERLSEELGIHTRVVGWWDFSRALPSTRSPSHLLVPYSLRETSLRYQRLEMIATQSLLDLFSYKTI